MGLYNANIIGGKSAYVSAVEGGYTGTESEFYSTLGNLGLTFSSTLATGETTVVFEDERLTTESVLDSVYTSIFGVKVKSATFGEGSLTLEFPTQTEDMEVKAVVDADVSDNLVGASGKDGKDGVDGKSAYQYAVDGGYEGTEEEFASLMASGGGSNEGDWVKITFPNSATSGIDLRTTEYKEFLINGGNGSGYVYSGARYTTKELMSIYDNYSVNNSEVIVGFASGTPNGFEYKVIKIAYNYKLYNTTSGLTLLARK